MYKINTTALKQIILYYLKLLDAVKPWVFKKYSKLWKHTSIKLLFYFQGSHTFGIRILFPFVDLFCHSLFIWYCLSFVEKKIRVTTSTSQILEVVFHFLPWKFHNKNLWEEIKIDLKKKSLTIQSSRRGWGQRRQTFRHGCRLRLINDLQRRLDTTEIRSVTLWVWVSISVLL